MKFPVKYAAVAIASFFSVGSVSALDVSLGVKGGLNLAKMWGYDKDKFEIETGFSDNDIVMKPGLIIGGICDVKIHKFFSIQPEVMFSMKGMKMKGKMSLLGFSYDYAASVNMNYLEIPVLFKLNIPAGIVTPNLYFGPATAFRVGVSGWSKMDDEKENMTSEEIKEIKETSKVVDFGLAFGGGAGIKAGPGSVVVDIRYTLGLVVVDKLTDEMKDAGMTEDDLSGAKNGALSFMIGYAFDIGGR